MLPPRPLDTRLCDPSGSWLSTRDCFSRINDWKAILFMLACISSATDPPSRFKYIRVILVSANLTTSSAIRISEKGQWWWHFIQNTKENGMFAWPTWYWCHSTNEVDTRTRGQLKIIFKETWDSRWITNKESLSSATRLKLWCVITCHEDLWYQMQQIRCNKSHNLVLSL